MTEVKGVRAITVGRQACTICHVTCGRFPHWLMFENMSQPDVVCGACYRVAMVIEHMKFHGAYKVME